MRIELLVIDPQNDFCSPHGALSVPNANEDMDRLALMIKRLGSKLNRITCTLDSHHKLHIANPDYWVDINGNHPPGDATTVITSADVQSGKWIPTITELRGRALQYLKDLEATQRYEHRIWPEHCLIGSEGSVVWNNLFDAFLNWESRPSIVNYVTKGSNLNTEHFSAVRAEIPDPEDETTQLNTALISSLEKNDVTLIAGEASTHCVASTIMDIIHNLGNPDYAKKMILLKDATSPIPGLEFLEDRLIKDITAVGMQISTTKDFMS